MADLNTAISIIILNMKGINTLIKGRDCQSRLKSEICMQSTGEEL